MGGGEAAEEYGKCEIIVSQSNEVAEQADLVFTIDHGELNQKNSNFGCLGRTEPTFSWR